MKYTVALVAMAALARAAADISMLPECSLDCIREATKSATKCEVEDYPCVCENMEALTAAATTCVIKACGASVALNEVVPATKKFCAEVEAGGGEEPPKASSSAVEPPSSSDAPEPSKSEDPKPSETSEAPEPTGGDDEEPEETSSAGSSVVTSAPTPPASTGEPAAPTSSVETGGAVGKVAGLGMVLLGAVAAL